MATTKLPESTEGDLRVSIDNGDYEAVKAAMAHFGISDDIEAVRIAIAMLSLTAQGQIFIKKGPDFSTGAGGSESGDSDARQ